MAGENPSAVLLICESKTITYTSLTTTFAPQCSQVYLGECHMYLSVSQWLSGKESACNAEVAGRGEFSLSLKDTLEKCMATQYSILAWRIPWMEESVGYCP